MFFLSKHTDYIKNLQGIHFKKPQIKERVKEKKENGRTEGGETEKKKCLIYVHFNLSFKSR